MPIINTIKGDLVKLAKRGEFRAICHGCNTKGVMGSGIAPQIANAFEGVRESDLNFANGHCGSHRLGYYSHVSVPLSADDTKNGNKVLTIFNMYTQDFMGCTDSYYPPVSYKAVKECFERLNESAVEFKKKIKKDLTLGMPLIGAGLAGGDWEIIKFIVDNATPDVKITLVEYDPTV